MAVMDTDTATKAPPEKAQLDVNVVVEVDPTTKQEVAADPWALPELAPTGVPWRDLDRIGKIKRVVFVFMKTAGLLLCLYVFICSLNLLSTSFRLLGGKATGAVFQNSELLKNPIVGLMIGILGTVLLQSSSTTTSVIVSMVAADFLTVRDAIPLVMGANIGTSVTNTIISLTQVTDRDQFRRAFAGATVHDMFNWMSVITFLIVEMVSGYLYHLSGVIVANMEDSGTVTKFDIIKAITKPLTKLIIQVDKKVIQGWALNDTKYLNVSSIMKNVCHVVPGGEEECKEKYLFYHMKDNGDVVVGIILLLVSLFFLCSCLICMVNILYSMMRGTLATVIRKTLNADIPYVPWMTGYIAILVGIGMTILVQSSSVFTSALTPLVGVGVLTVERMYPLTLGSNVGTTTTALLAAAAGDNRKNSLQIALVHFFFNISGILLFYVVPFMRVPIQLAKVLGNTTAKYRWFAVFYLLCMFLLLPAAVFGLSQVGHVVLYVVVLLVLLLLLLVIVINVLQSKKSSFLPPFLRTWNFLPEWLRSLKPWDRTISMLMCCKKLRTDKEEEMKPIKVTNKNEEVGIDNPALQH